MSTFSKIARSPVVALRALGAAYDPRRLPGGIAGYRSANPVLRASAIGMVDETQAAPAEGEATPVARRGWTLAWTALAWALLAVGGMLIWSLTNAHDGRSYFLIDSFLAFAFWVTAMARMRRMWVFPLLFALAEGVMLGGLASWSDRPWHGAALQALVATIAVGLASLVLRVTGVGRTGGRVVRIVPLLVLAAALDWGGGWVLSQFDGLYVQVVTDASTTAIVVAAVVLVLQSLLVASDSLAIETDVVGHLPRRAESLSAMAVAFAPVWMFGELLTLPFRPFGRGIARVWAKSRPDVMRQGRRVVEGELGSVRVVLGIVVIWTVFTIANDRFLSALNLTNLMLQITAVGTMSLGVVLVLLLGEIDLSVGWVSGVSAAVMAVLNVKHGWPGDAAILAGLAAGAAIGVLHAIIITRFRVPPFVVTLAGSLAWQGALLYVLGDTGTLNINDGDITGLTSTFFLDSWGWTAIAVVVVLMGATAVVQRRQRDRAGLPTHNMAITLLPAALVGVTLVAAMSVLVHDRGLPLALVILVGLTAFFEYLIRRTKWGRHVFAVGGNAEAARRAGIKVQGIRFSVFVLASTMAAAGGIMAASRLLAVNQGSGGGDVLLTAIAGPVIAGTSLFGGRGSMWSALLGAIVIGSISNGMDLLALDSSVKYMITGGVLALSVTIDSLARNRRREAGRV